MKNLWVRLECAVFKREKLASLTALGKLSYLSAICESGELLTDGIIRPDMLPRILSNVGATRKNWNELKTAGLINGHGPWEIIGYLDHQRSRADWEKARQASVASSRRHRAKSQEQNTPRDTSPHMSRDGSRDVSVINTEVEVELLERSLGVRTTTPYPQAERSQLASGVSGSAASVLDVPADDTRSRDNPGTDAGAARDDGVEPLGLDARALLERLRARG